MPTGLPVAFPLRVLLMEVVASNLGEYIFFQMILGLLPFCKHIGWPRPAVNSSKRFVHHSPSLQSCFSSPEAFKTQKSQSEKGPTEKDLAYRINDSMCKVLKSALALMESLCQVGDFKPLIRALLF